MPKSPTRVAAGKKSRRKGSNNERAMAKKFESWWGSGSWARTPMSGGWATAAVREDFQTCGDIITTARDFPFCVELKKHEGWTLDQVIHNDKCIVFDWWKQVTAETPSYGVSLLVAGRNHIPHVAIFSTSQMVNLVFSVTGQSEHMPWESFSRFVFHGNETLGIPELVIMPLEDFFKISPKNFARSNK